MSIYWSSFSQLPVVCWQLHCVQQHTPAWVFKLGTPGYVTDLLELQRVQCTEAKPHTYVMYHTCRLLMMPVGLSLSEYPMSLSQPEQMPATSLQDGSLRRQQCPSA